MNGTTFTNEIKEIPACRRTVEISGEKVKDILRKFGEMPNAAVEFLIDSETDQIYKVVLTQILP